MAQFPFRVLLVPTDFSACADEALSLADRMARGGGRLVLMHASELSGGVDEQTVVQPDPHRPATTMGELARASALARMRDQLGSLGVETPCSLEVRLARPLDAILEAARDWGAHVIVMGTHGRTGLDHLLLGSVTERVVRAATIPVLTVRGGCPSGAPEARTEAEEQALDESSG